MRFFRDLSIRYKLTLLLMSVVGLVLLAIAVGIGVNEVRSTRSIMKTKYLTLAKVVAAQTGAALSIADIDASGVQQIMADLKVEPSIRFAALFNADGIEVARYPAEMREKVRLPKAVGAHFTSDAYLDVVEEVKLDDGAVIGRIYLRHSTKQLQEELRRTIAVTIVVFVIAQCVAVALSFVLQGFISTPILQLAQMMRQVSKDHDFTLRARPRGKDELGVLSEGFNAMLFEIQRRDSDLAQHREQLEKTVEQRTEMLMDRTRELTTANAELTRSREALEAANKELEAFSYSASHDLRAPLRAIDGFSKILLNDYAAHLPSDAQEYLLDVRSNAQQMGTLVDDLLAFSRLSRQPAKRQPVDTQAIVQECLEELQSELKDRHVAIRVGDLRPCLGDPNLLKQVWTNLLSNAVKYTGRAEKAVIEVDMRDIDDPGQIGYFVKDNGVGFDMRYADKLFGVFQRLHRSEDYAGTGVGLAIVQRILHRHGGQIWAEAVPDKGATFYFTLPSDEAQHE